MPNYRRFLENLPPHLRLKVLDAIEKIVENKLDDLDIILMHGYKGFFRCRVGKIRIVFERIGSDNIVYDVGFRGGIYK